MEQLKILPDIPKPQQCLVCKGQSQGTQRFTFKGVRREVCSDVRLCVNCKDLINKTDPKNIKISFYQCGGLAFIEEIHIKS